MRLRGLGLCAIGAILLVAAVAASDTDGPDDPRVRSTHPYIRAMIEEAGQRSPTFRRLVETIEATDGIVYVEQGICTHSLRACLALWVTPTNERRFLRVLVDARQPDWEVMSSIGHELQHAVEVLSNPSIRSFEGIFAFYQREGFTMGDSFESGAAMRVGDVVRNEVASFAKKR